MSEAWEILENPLLKEFNREKRLYVKQAIPQCPDSAGRHILSLWKYLSASPHRFYNRQVHVAYFDWLSNRIGESRSRLKSYIADNAEQLDRAISSLDEINQYDWHDSELSNDEFAAIRFVDQVVNPAYLRLVEAVLFPLIRVVAFFSRIDRGKGTEGLDLWSAIEEVGSGPLGCAIVGYRHVVRNGIGHGGVAYLENAIRYKDKKGNEETYAVHDFLRLFDDVLDCCNGLALGLHTFLLAHHPDDFVRPRSLLLHELKEETKLPWWEVDACLPATRSNSSQLIIYAKASTSDVDKVRFSAFQSAILAEQFAPGYGRYFVSIRSSKAWPGFAAFDGVKLADLRKQNDSSLSDYGDVLENRLLFFVPTLKPLRVLRRLETIAAVLKYQFAVTAIRRKKNLTVEARGATVHRNSWGAVLKGGVVLSTGDVDLSKDGVLAHCKRIVSAALSEARKQQSWMSVARYLPVGYARVAVFRKNYRKRRLSEFGLGEDLVCTIQVQRIRRIKSPDIFGSTVEVHGKYRVAWNQSWLRVSGAHQHIAGDV
ncbi:hypothetical protein [Sinimarinibacterium flocculans]|uniref:hypothetical protein n=1 Tax=Sinimarinibacterium flocculans TaxID=985250 RepID=UPI0035173ABC